jgi:hypothetical protein
MNIAIAGSIKWTDVKKRVCACRFYPTVVYGIIESIGDTQIFASDLSVMATPWHKSPTRTRNGFYQHSWLEFSNKHFTTLPGLFPRS